MCKYTNGVYMKYTPFFLQRKKVSSNKTLIALYIYLYEIISILINFIILDL